MYFSKKKKKDVKYEDALCLYLTAYRHWEFHLSVDVIIIKYYICNFLKLGQLILTINVHEIVRTLVQWEKEKEIGKETLSVIR